MAEHIVWSQLRGHPWLGAKKIIQYGTRALKGVAAVDSGLDVKTETAAMMHVQGHNRFSQVIGTQAMNRAVEKAAEAGVCVVSMNNTSSGGALGYFAQLAADQGYIAMVINNAPPLMSVYGGCEKIIGNQAFAIGSPAGKYGTLMFDTALSEITLVGIHRYELLGERLPEGLALDMDGNPTTDPAEALAGILLPMGQHRGSGLAIMWEVLTGILAGGERFMNDVTMPDVFDRSQSVSIFMLVIDPSVCMSQETFIERVENLIERLRSSRPAPGFDRVRVPGESGAQRVRQAMENGFTIPAQLFRQLEQFGARFNVSFDR